MLGVAFIFVGKASWAKIFTWTRISRFQLHFDFKKLINPLKDYWYLNCKDNYNWREKNTNKKYIKDAQSMQKYQLTN